MRIIFNILIIVILVPQKPEWNPVISKLREKNIFATYESAKQGLSRITWTAIFLFYFFHAYFY